MWRFRKEHGVVHSRHLQVWHLIKRFFWGIVRFVFKQTYWKFFRASLLVYVMGSSHFLGAVAPSFYTLFHGEQRATTRKSKSGRLHGEGDIHSENYFTPHARALQGKSTVMLL